MAQVVDKKALDSGRSSKTSLTYDPKTGSWKPTTATSNSSSSSGSSTNTTKTPSSSNTGAVNVSKNVDSRKEAEKEYIEAEFNVLTGELSLTPTEKSIRIKVNDTVKLEGIGKYLSGLYFVSSVSRTLNKDSGYSHSLFLIKNGFGDSLKKAQPVETEEPRKEEVKKEPAPLKVGDSVRIVGADAIYSNASQGVKVPEWVKKKTLTIQQFSDDMTRVLVMPIFSWTYVKYIQKV